MLTSRFGVIIVDELTWGHVQQTVLLQGKVPGDYQKKQEIRLTFKYGTMGPSGLNQDLSFT